MSLIKKTWFKKPGCGDPPKGNIRDSLGGIIDFQVVGTDPDGSFVTGASITVGTGDYAPAIDDKNHDGTFLICIETDGGLYFVTLADGSDFIITPVQATAYLGQWLPMRIWSVNVGTTGDFSVGY